MGQGHSSDPLFHPEVARDWGAGKGSRVSKYSTPQPKLVKG